MNWSCGVANEAMQEEMRKRDLRQHGQTYLLTMMIYFQKMALWRVVCTGVPYVGALVCVHGAKT